MNIDDMVTDYRNNGYTLADARSKVCQDIVLLKISKSNFKDHITIKGGVVMHNISNSVRRATQDLDLDFIKYSLDDISIKNFIDRLNSVKDGLIISVINSINESICLLINSKEQIFTEKLKSLLKIGFRSTGYKDLYDFYYLITETNLDKDKLLKE